jgi:hypothetical protein
MPATKESTIYKWEELSQTAKEKARQWYLEGMDYEWWEGVYESAKEDGESEGFYIDKIFFSGFCSQGDGASWTGQVDVRQWLEVNEDDSIGLSAWCQLIQEGIVSKFSKVEANNSHYCHESTMQFSDVEDGTEAFNDDFPLLLPSIFKGMSIENLFNIIATDPDCQYKGVDDITKAITESGKDYARDIYQRLREEYEYLCSEEMMLDHFNCNDYHFDEDGRLA